ncbi:ATP-dependent DNA helicase [Actinomarinicola tropica]|uniref:DNA 5'-3' helicase n=1 Tax=Actinomarinicola tropica TaxID=2789776 RepID=A0A5Q2RR16_9ACTN|nr:ATP-dependent DNA helicase [Actinomarinicola tropica]QGG95635.1 ATP-dependent DNA helicase [Actinomarinicola tropica]
MDVTGTLAEVVAGLPSGGEARPGQAVMAEAVARAIESERHLVVQAGTGTGKSLAYLVPAVLSGERVVVATATKGLQDQLAGKDLPFLAARLGREITYAVLKGRSNYVCLQRVAELDDADDQLGLDVGDRPPTAEIKDLVRWAATSTSGDRAELSFEPSHRAWSAVSVGPRECPGQAKCPRGEICFTERARRAAAEADVVVVNTHLYGLDVATHGAVLPEHEVVVIDEAHQLEEVISATAGTEIAAGRFAALARSTRAILTDESLTDGLDAAGAALADVLRPSVGRRLPPSGDPGLVQVLTTARERASRILDAVRKVPTDGPADVAARRERALQAASTLIEDVDVALDVPATHVAWVDGPADTPSLQVTPIDVSEVLAAGLWGERTAILTSATIPAGLPASLGLADGTYEQLDVGSPFDYEANALLYCAVSMPDPRHDDYEAALHRELESLIVAAGGRTLALFTSWRAMDLAAQTLKPRLPWKVLTQRDLPKPALVEAFRDDEESCLFATLGFWQGVDLPGRTLSLVTIDRLPFPRPDEPVLQARRERARADAFRTIDLPRAATLLAQGAGRLIRTGTDRGVVAVLDSRLATAQRYRWEIVNSLPPMRRTRDRSEVERFLRELRDGAAA